MDTELAAEVSECGPGDGREALEECARRLPDLLLLDLTMPVLDGYGVPRELDHPNWAWFPVIVVSGNTHASHDFPGRVVVQLRKPVDLSHLCREVKRALDREDELPADLVARSTPRSPESRPYCQGPGSGYV